MPILLGSGLWDTIDAHVRGYFKFYDRYMPVPGHAEKVNQVEAWKKELTERRKYLKTEYGESRDRKGDEADHAEMRATFVFPAFYDPITATHEPLLLILKDEFKKFGHGDFPQTKTVEGKRDALEFHRRYKELLSLPQKM